MNHNINAKTVERWGLFEISVNGKTDGNPFTDYQIHGVFHHKNETVEADGFYDGDGVYKVRFMPSFEGTYAYTVSGSAIDGTAEGTFTATAPGKSNHGPVRVANTYHFAYEDGAPYYPIGTTCYVWTHQDQALQEKTLESLKNSPFNKIRFCIFPKHYVYNFHEPITYPYKGTPCKRTGLTADNFSFETEFEGNNWDFSRFDPEHFRLFEKRIEDLIKLGIEADLIVMHPYDCWGFSKMGAEADDLYWNYVVNRFSAFRNVWWSLANEYDLMKEKTIADWERYAAIICRQDKYNHLRSIHNCHGFYNYTRPWITHCSIQRQDAYKSAEPTNEWRERFRKPVVLDEICYEGDIEHGWGNITGEEMTRRFWEGVCRGGYPGHGETLSHPNDILWWSHGGELYGESPKRIAFLLDILKQAPGPGLKFVSIWWDCVTAVPDRMQNMNDYFLIYYGFSQPCLRRFHFDDETSYKAEIIDTWDMTVTNAGVHKGNFVIALPKKQYMAIRLTKQ